MSDSKKRFQEMYDSWRVKELSEKAIAHRKYMRDGKLTDHSGTATFVGSVFEKLGPGGTFDEILKRLESSHSGDMQMNLGWALMRLAEMGLVRVEKGGRIVPGLQPND